MGVSFFTVSGGLGRSPGNKTIPALYWKLWKGWQGGTFLTLRHHLETNGHGTETGHAPADGSGTPAVNRAECQGISEVLSRIGDKWTVLVVELLGSGPMRFNELRRLIGGISQKMLTTTLRNLERDGFVTRTVFPTIPPRVDYELTDLGRELQVPVRALGLWARQNIGRIGQARDRFDQAAQG
ncbi:MAG: helix-turn-helix transcriptional regulator [Rhizobiaceae bacterium]|nr:helix-turn-helix transcriptional regulator [Rhizobiaceae bacterium]